MTDFRKLSDYATGGEWDYDPSGYAVVDAGIDCPDWKDAVCLRVNAPDGSLIAAAVNGLRAGLKGETGPHVLYTHDHVRVMIADAVAAERERCARVAEAMAIPIAGTPYQAGCGVVAEAIRKGDIK